MDAPPEEHRNSPPAKRSCRAVARALVRQPLVWLLLLAVLAHMRYPATGLWLDHFGDQKRFFRQAELLAGGQGFPSTSLPPGYPTFLAGVMLATRAAWPSGDAFVTTTRLLQIALAVASCALVYAAILPRSRGLAVAAFGVLALFPGFHRAAWWPISEILSIFLCSLLAYLLSMLERKGPSSCLCFALGLLTVAMLLTAPALVCVALPIWCYAAWRARRSVGQLAWLVAGSLLLTAPWQVHCHRTNGSVAWTFYTLPKSPPEFLRWYRTWARSEGDLGVFWNRGSLDTVPDDVFRSVDQRRHLEAIWRERFTNTDKHFSPEAAAAFGMAADRRIADDPWGHYVGLPLRRARRLWFHRGDLHGLEWEAFRLATLATLLLVAFWIARIRRGPRAVPLVVVSAVLVYTVLSAWWPGTGESRRNVPFYPLIAYTLYYWPRPVRGDDPKWPKPLQTGRRS